MIYLSTVVLFTITFIHFVQSVCVTDSDSILSGDYIQSGTHNEKPYYTLPLNSNCGYTSAILYYRTYYNTWTISFNEMDGSYTAECSSKTETPHTCSSWYRGNTKLAITVSYNQCDTLCSESNTLVISSSNSNLQSMCTGTFSRVYNQDNKNIFAKTNGIYWYFSYSNKKWVCYQYNNNQYDQGCSIGGYHIFDGYDSINSLGTCEKATSTASSTTSTSTTTTTTTTTTNAPASSTTSCSSVIISGREESNTFINGEWNKYPELINDKVYYTKGNYYLYFMGGCGFNRWIISNSLNNRNIDYDSTRNCYANSYFAQCQQNTDDVTDCSRQWEIAETGHFGSYFALDSNVITEKATSC